MQQVQRRAALRKLVNRVALIGYGQPAHAHERHGELHEHGQRGHRAGQRGVEPAAAARVAPGVLGAQVHELRLEPQRVAYGPEEHKALIQRVEQRKLQIRPHDKERHTRKARARADVDHGRVLWQIRLRRERVDEVFPRYVGFVRDGGEIHARVPLEKQRVVRLEPLELFGCQFGAKRAKRLLHAGTSGLRAGGVKPRLQ